MTQTEAGQGAAIPAEDRAIADAVARAAREAALMHARLGNPVAAFRDGKVVWLTPAEVFALLGEQPPVLS